MGVQYRNGKYFGGGSGGDGLIPISQEEFNKLTPEERDNHKSYFIYDAIAQTPSGTHVGIRYYPHQEDFDALSEAEKAAIPDLVITGGKRDALSARDVQYKQGTVEAALDDVDVDLNELIDTTDKLVDDLGTVRFGIDSNGNYGYKKVGADTVIPFKKGNAYFYNEIGDTITIPESISEGYLVYIQRNYQSFNNPPISINSGSISQVHAIDYSISGYTAIWYKVMKITNANANAVITFGDRYRLCATLFVVK